MTSKNTVERRSDLLAEAIRSRVNATFHTLTEPTPAFRVAKSPLDQVREYQALLNSGQLATLRESMGGPYSEADVDRYVEHMERLAPKFAQQLYNLPPEGDF